MTFEPEKSLQNEKDEIIAQMIRYMKYGAADSEEDEEFDPEFEAGYHQLHVDRCDSILTRFLSRMHEQRGAFGQRPYSSGTPRRFAYANNF